MAGLRAGFPDIRYTIEDLIAEGDKVAVRWTWTGTHEGSFRGLAPSHAHVTDTAIVIDQLASGKIVRAWLANDRLGFLQQIGVAPKNLGAPPGPPPPAPAASK